MKLTLEEYELLTSIIDTDAWPVLLKVVGIHVSDIDSRVLSYNLEEGPEGLVIAKARSEGAKLLQQRINELKSKMKK